MRLQRIFFVSQTDLFVSNRIIFCLRFRVRIASLRIKSHQDGKPGLSFYTPAGLETDIATGQELAGAELGAETGAPQGEPLGTVVAPPAGAPPGAPPIPTI